MALMIPRLIYTVNCPNLTKKIVFSGFEFSFTGNQHSEYNAIIFHFLSKNETNRFKTLFKMHSRYFVLIVDDCNLKEIDVFIRRYHVKRCEDKINSVLEEIVKQMQWEPFIHPVKDLALFTNTTLIDALNNIHFLPRKMFCLEYMYQVVAQKFDGFYQNPELLKIVNLAYVLKDIHDTEVTTTPLFQNIIIRDKVMEVQDSQYQYPNKLIYIRKKYPYFFTLLLNAIRNPIKGQETQRFLLRGHPGVGKTSLLYYLIGKLIAEKFLDPILLYKGKKGGTEYDTYVIQNHGIQLGYIKTDYIICDTYNYVAPPSVKPKVIFMVSSPDERNYSELKYPRTNLFLDRFDDDEIKEWVNTCLEGPLKDTYAQNPGLYEKYGRVTRHIYYDLVMKQFLLDYWEKIYVPTLLNVLAENGMVYFTTNFGSLEWEKNPGKIKPTDTNFSHYILTFAVDKYGNVIDGWSDIVSPQIQKIVKGLATLPNSEDDRTNLAKLYNGENHKGRFSEIIWIQIALFDMFYRSDLFTLFPVTKVHILHHAFNQAVITIKKKESEPGLVLIFSDVCGSEIKVIGPDYVVGFTEDKNFTVNTRIFKLIEKIRDQNHLQKKSSYRYYIISHEMISNVYIDNSTKFPHVLESSTFEDVPDPIVEILNYTYDIDSGFSFLTTILPNQLRKKPTQIVKQFQQPPSPPPKPSPLPLPPIRWAKGDMLKLISDTVPDWINGNRLKCLQTNISHTEIYSLLSEADEAIRKFDKKPIIDTCNRFDRDVYMNVFAFIVKELKKSPNVPFSQNFLIYGDKGIGKTTLCNFLVKNLIRNHYSVFFILGINMYYYFPKSTEVPMMIADPSEVCGENIDVVVSDCVLIGEDDYSKVKCVILVTNKYDVKDYKTFRSKRSPLELYIPLLSETEMDLYLTEPDIMDRLKTRFISKKNYIHYFGYHPFPFFDLDENSIPNPSQTDIDSYTMTPPLSAKWNYSSDYYIYQTEGLEKIKDTLTFRSCYLESIVQEIYEKREFIHAYKKSYQQMSKPDPMDYETMIIFCLKNVTKDFTVDFQLMSCPHEQHPKVKDLEFFNFATQKMYPLDKFLTDTKFLNISLKSSNNRGIISLQQFPRFPTIDFVLRCDFIDIMFQVTTSDSHIFNPRIYIVFHNLFHTNLGAIEKYFNKNKEELPFFCEMIGYISIENRLILFENNLSGSIKELLIAFDPQFQTSTTKDLRNGYFNSQSDVEKCAIDDYLHYFVNCLEQSKPLPDTYYSDYCKQISFKELSTFSPELLFVMVNEEENPVQITVSVDSELRIPFPYDELLQEITPISINYFKFIKEFRMKMSFKEMSVYYDQRNLKLDPESVKRQKTLSN